MILNKQFLNILLCPNEHNLYQLALMDKNADYIASLTKSLDSEAIEPFLFISHNHQKMTKISIHEFKKLLQDVHASITICYCSYSVSEYLSMLYFVSLCKDLPIQIHDFAETRVLQDDTKPLTLYCATCNELDEATYKNATFTTLTQNQMDAYHKLWQQLKDHKQLKCFIDAQHKQIQLLEHNAFDGQIKQMVHEQKSFGECYQYFLNHYGLSEQWLISRFEKLKLSL